MEEKKVFNFLFGNVKNIQILYSFFKRNLPVSTKRNVFFFFFQSELVHFECCDNIVITSNAPNEEDIVLCVKENNVLIDDSS